VSRPALGTTQTHIKWVLWALSLQVKWPGHEAEQIHFHGVVLG